MRSLCGLDQLAGIFLRVGVTRKNLRKGVLLVFSSDEEDDFATLINERLGEGDARIAVLIADCDQAIAYSQSIGVGK